MITKAGMHFLRVDLGDIRFLDARAFIGGSLSQLAEEHIASGESLPVTRSLISHFPSPAHDLLLSGKQCFPYEFVTDFDKLKCPCFPASDHFYSSLKRCGVSESDYEHAQAVWAALNCKTLKDYQFAKC